MRPPTSEKTEQCRCCTYHYDSCDFRLRRNNQCLISIFVLFSPHFPDRWLNVVMNASVLAPPATYESHVLRGHAQGSVLFKEHARMSHNFSLAIAVAACQLPVLALVNFMIYRLPKVRCCTETINVILLYQFITSFNIFQVTNKFTLQNWTKAHYTWQNIVLKTKSNYHTVSTADKFSLRLPSKSTLVVPKMRWQPIKKKNSFNQTMHYALHAAS
jgi:hypothetical protein